MSSAPAVRRGAAAPRGGGGWARLRLRPALAAAAGAALALACVSVTLSLRSVPGITQLEAAPRITSRRVRLARSRRSRCRLSRACAAARAAAPLRSAAPRACGNGGC